MHKLLVLGLLICQPLVADPRLGLPSLNIPADNPQSKAKIALGRDMFHDPRFSADGTVSCAVCHRPDMAFTDGMPTAVGISQQVGLRNVPTVINAAFFKMQFWDGRANSLEEQALAPMLNPLEHGLKNEAQILDVVTKDSDYRRRIQNIFQIKKSAISVQNIANAIASYERSLVAGNSLFDQYYFGRDRSKLSASAARGLLIFRRKGNCANCHEISLNNALFSDQRFYNIGIGSARLETVLDRFLKVLQHGKKQDQYPLTTRQRSELGRFNVTKVIEDIGKFKTPSLRNVALTAPYMHDGSLRTLEDVVDYYDKGGRPNRFLDPAIYPLKLTIQEKSNLVAFMKSLNSN